MSAAIAKQPDFLYAPVAIKLSQLQDNEANARLRFDEKKVEALADSMRANGLQNRIVVRKVGQDKYEVKQGSRRFMAAKLLKWETIEAHLAPDTMTNKSHDVNNLVENLQRENLTPYETAMGFRRLAAEHDMSNVDISKQTGISASHIGNCLRVVQNLAPDIMKQWAAGHPLATFDTVVKLASIKGKDGEPDHNAQVAAWDQIVKGGRFSGNTVVGAEGGESGDSDVGGSRKQQHRVLMKNVIKVQAFLKTDGEKLKAPSDMGAWVASLIQFFTGKRAKPPEGITLASPEKEAKAKKGKKGKKKEK